MKHSPLNRINDIAYKQQLNVLIYVIYSLREKDRIFNLLDIDCHFQFIICIDHWVFWPLQSTLILKLYAHVQRQKAQCV